MIGFYLTTTGEYSPEQVADISNSIILDDKNKTFKVMNQYVFEFQKLSTDYENLTADSSREGLSIYGANKMYDDILAKIPSEASFERIEASINTLEEWQTVVNASVDVIDSSISSLETWHDVVNTSISDINSSISSIKTDYIPNVSMGVNSGVATLDENGHVPSSQLPSYVDDIIEGYLYEGAFYEDAQHEEPITGEGGKIYVDLPSNTSWRWGGSAYIQVSESLALGETEGTAYEGSKGKALKDAFDLHEASTAIHITADERTAWNNASTSAHTHSNKSVLDGITSDDIANFIDASNAKHTHANEGILNGLTDTSISNWDDAASKAHEHINSAILNGITDSSFHSHSNKSVLDGITDSSFHSHENKDILDGITDASISAWDAGEENVNADWNATSGDASILNRPTLGTAAEKDATDIIESSTGALVTDGAIKAYVDDTISKAHEHANIGVLNGITDSSFHTHDNMSILNGLGDASVTAWNSAAADAHTHDNKSILDSISETDVENWIDASNSKHEHNNKTILDGIADSSFHIHENKELLDDITSTDIANWIDASNNQHTHSNADILNGFTDASIADFIRDTSYGQGELNDLITGTDTTPKVWDSSVINAYIAVLDANAVRYKGDINAGTGAIVDTQDTLTSVANKKGDVYVVSTEGTLCDVDMQVGDSIIFKKNVAKNTAPVATDLTFVQGTVKVTNENATLQWGQLTKIANVEGIDISVALPADPTIELTSRVEDISTYAIEVSVYAADVSSRLDTIETTLISRIENVSTYAINVSTYVADVSSNLDTVNTTLTSRIANVSTYAINVSTYAVNVSTNLSNNVTVINSHFSNVDSSLIHHDSSIHEIYDNVYELTQVWAAAWYDISTHLSITDSSLNEHIVETTGYGAFADKPSNPQTGQIYFATDKQTTEGATNGIPIWYNGTNWVDALGRTVS